MSDEPGNDYNPLFMRLHDGLREFQTRRNNRRQRHEEAEPADPAPMAPPATPPISSVGSAGGMPGVGLEPQGFVSFGGRLIPLFGEIQPAAVAPPPTATTPVAEEVTPPASSPPVPAPETRRGTPPRQATAAALNLPPPTPPACLHLFAQSTTPPGTSESATAPPTPATPDETTTTNDASSADAQVEAAPQLRAEVQVQQLEQVHSEHRAVLAMLLKEHRDALRDQAESIAARQDQSIRELLAEHRAELDRAQAAHAEHIRDLLAQHRVQEQRITDVAERVERHATTIIELGALLSKQAEVQAQDHEQTAHHLDDLSSFIGDLTQTVSLLAMATYERQPEAAAMRPRRAPSPPVVDAPADEPLLNPPEIDLLPGIAASSSSAGAARLSPTPSAAGPPHHPEPVTAGPVQDLGVCHQQTRVDDFVRDFGDDELMQDIDDPDGPPGRFPLAPITPLDVLKAHEATHV